MLKIEAMQMEVIDRRYFYGRLGLFLVDNCRRADFKDWASDTDRLYSMWDAIWHAAREHSEHDCALFLIFLAICAFEERVVEAPGILLDHVADRRVVLKQFISEQGYFYFTAFDYPTASQEEGENHV
ncbi:MAG: hypothetical protein Q8M09_04350 [Pseudomonadota bacterium]|nr:hypothetical protein [Pseudomonadota bacterium]MDP1903468.1 hypothetical protein [Pseudomonadota bacterium]MDP2351575.1 hypothetical protein [Pseudomonadota bacterium]